MSEEKHILFTDKNSGKVYRVIKQIGKGAQGIVYKVIEKIPSGIQIQSGCKYYALKQINVLTEIAERRVKTELKIVKKIAGNCKVLPCIHGYWNTDNKYYILYDFISGNSLDELYLPAHCDIWKKIIYLLVLGLAYIHSLGVLHLDIKPDNIIVTDNFRVFYVDFGLSCLMPDCDPAGTPQYMPPEFELKVILK